jgi:hypothetical protein
MLRIQVIADFARRFEAADARPLAGVRVNHRDGPFALVGRGTGRRRDAR